LREKKKVRIQRLYSIYIVEGGLGRKGASAKMRVRGCTLQAMRCAYGDALFLLRAMLVGLDVLLLLLGRGATTHYCLFAYFRSGNILLGWLVGDVFRSMVVL